MIEANKYHPSNDECVLFKITYAFFQLKYLSNVKLQHHLL